MADSTESGTVATPEPTECPSLASGKPDPQLVEIWKKYEDIAMHFNDLIMRWRLQAMGGLATLVTIGGFVASDATTRTVGYRAVFILSGMLACAWTGVGFIDLFYYRQLLKGAVDCILKFESKNPSIELSTRIEAEAKWGGRVAPWVFYSFGLAPLVAIFLWSGIQLCHLQTEQRRHTKDHPTQHPSLVAAGDRTNNESHRKGLVDDGRM